jgi:septum formation protein
LERLGVTFSVVAPHVEERTEGDPTEVAKENALRKARAVALADPRDSILGADTVVVLEAERELARSGGPASGRVQSTRPPQAGAHAIFGKPAGELDAREMLRALSGRSHAVIGGVALLTGSEERVGTACTQVSFRVLDEGLLDWYVATGEWRGRAGGYAIQGAGAGLVREVRGDYENVVGLPVAVLLDICPELLSLE